MKNIMFSLADAIDKLVIENIKIFNTREKLLTEDLSDTEYVELYDKMMRMNDNRGMICDMVDKKAKEIYYRKDPNDYIKKIKTYED